MISPDLRNCTHVHIRRDFVKPPLASHCNGAFLVVLRSAKTFTIDIAGRSEVISLGRFKVAFLAVDIFLTRVPHGYAELPFTIIRK